MSPDLDTLVSIGWGATVQQCNSATVQQCNSSTVQQFNRATVQQFKGNATSLLLHHLPSGNFAEQFYSSSLDVILEITHA